MYSPRHLKSMLWIVATFPMQAPPSTVVNYER